MPQKRVTTASIRASKLLTICTRNGGTCPGFIREQVLNGLKLVRSAPKNCIHFVFYFFFSSNLFPILFVLVLMFRRYQMLRWCSLSIICWWPGEMKQKLGAVENDTLGYCGSSIFDRTFSMNYSILSCFESMIRIERLILGLEVGNTGLCFVS